MMNETSPMRAPSALTDDLLCVCPMCHTVAAAMTASALSRGGYWLCIRCGQGWDTSRLATRAAYEDYVERTHWLALASVAR
jgi:hypothetical protein